MLDLDALLPQVRALAGRAGAAIMKVYAPDFDVERKADDSPVTAADLAAEWLITHGLKTLTPDLPFVAEEAPSADALPALYDGPLCVVYPLHGPRDCPPLHGKFQCPRIPS